MAYKQKVQVQGGTQTSGTGTTFGSSVAAGDLLIWEMINSSDASLVTPTDNQGNTWTLRVANATSFIYVWDAVASSSGTLTVTSTKTGGGTIYVDQLGLNYGGPFTAGAYFDVATSAAAVGSVSSLAVGPITTTGSADLLVGIIEGFGDPWTASAGFSQDLYLTSGFSNGNQAVDSATAIAAGSHTLTWTFNYATSSAYSALLAYLTAAAATTPRGWITQADQPQDRIEIIGY